MKLVSLTVKDFRSITKAHKLHLGNLTVLIGPNNEGKSNILRAMVTGLEVLSRGRRFLRNPGVTRGGSGATSGTFVLPSFLLQEVYVWETDYPIGHQKKKPDGVSELVLEFKLDEIEIEDFKNSIKSNLNGNLPLRITLGREKLNVSVVKKGPGGKALTAKSALIAEFVRDRIALQYIPTVRTAQSSHEVVDRMLEGELRSIEDDPAYKAALNQIASLQQPIFKRIAQTIKSTLVEFLPNIRDVKVGIASEARIRALRRSSEIVIDDGTPTQLKFKGDGVQSLAALALMRHSSDGSAKTGHIVIAVEEPESHLHPSAIHGLRSVLLELAERQQVVLTTHCPLFVDRNRVSANILVNNKKAKSAKSIEEIRDALGVRASDNLRHAELVLLVEGEEDRLILEPLLCSHSAILRSAFQQNTIALETLGGGSNLAYKAGLVQEALCACHCYLDDDRAGRAGFEKARLAGLLTDGDVTFCVCAGLAEAEIEDMYEVSEYEAVIQNRYRVSLRSPKFKGKGKWSDRLKETFRNQGKNWDDRLESEVKHVVAAALAAVPDKALNSHKRSSFDALIQTLESRLRESRRP